MSFSPAIGVFSTGELETPTFPVGTTARQAIPVFGVTPATGQPKTIAGSLMASPPTGYPIGTTPQQALPVVVVNPYTGAPLSTTAGSGNHAFPGSTIPQQALPVVLVDPTSGSPLSGTAVASYLASLAVGAVTGKAFSADFSADFA